MRSIFFLLTAVFTFLHLRSFGEGAPPNANQKSLIGTLSNPELVDGCGCYLRTPAENLKKNSKRFVFMSGLENEPAYVNIAGKDVKLKQVSSTEPKEAKKGGRFSKTYSAPGLKVQLDFLTTKVCGPHDEECEVTDYEATLNAQQGSDSQSVKLAGECG